MFHLCMNLNRFNSKFQFGTNLRLLYPHYSWNINDSVRLHCHCQTLALSSFLSLPAQDFNELAVCFFVNCVKNWFIFGIFNWHRNKTGISWYWQLVSNGMTPHEGSIIEPWNHTHWQKTHSQIRCHVKTVWFFKVFFIFYCDCFLLLLKKGSGIQYLYELDFFFEIEKGNRSNSIRSSLKRLVFFLNEKCSTAGYKGWIVFCCWQAEYCKVKEQWRR